MRELRPLLFACVIGTGLGFVTPARAQLCAPPPPLPEYDSTLGVGISTGWQLDRGADFWGWTADEATRARLPLLHRVDLAGVRPGLLVEEIGIARSRGLGEGSPEISAVGAPVGLPAPAEPGAARPVQESTTRGLLPSGARLPEDHSGSPA